MLFSSDHAGRRLGLGTWRMGESPRHRAAEVAAVRTALELGYRLIDTAEMYGEGGAEEVVGQALAEAFRAGDLSRDEVVVVSKVYPHNAGRRGVVQACERSLRRLGLDRLDLYLLHWRGRHPLAETVAGFGELLAQGRVVRWGVSNFDADDMAELWGVLGGQACAANQVYYSLGERGIEFDLLPWQQSRQITLMAYCPIDQGALSASAPLRELAVQAGATPAQLALAWLMQQGSAQTPVVPIPKAVQPAHLAENLAATSLVLDAATKARLDLLFPPPRRKQPLAMV